MRDGPDVGYAGQRAAERRVLLPLPEDGQALQQRPEYRLLCCQQ